MPKSAHARVNGADGTTIRRRNVSQVYRAGTGVYHLIFAPGQGIALSTHDVSVTAVGAAGRVVQLGNAGGVAPPAEANAPAGSTSLQVLAFQATDGAAANADFIFSAERL